MAIVFGPEIHILFLKLPLGGGRPPVHELFLKIFTASLSGLMTVGPNNIQMISQECYSHQGKIYFDTLKK